MLPFAAQAGIALAPTAVGMLARAFNRSKPTAYERELKGLKDFYREELGKGYASTAAGAGKIGILNDQDEQIRNTIDKTSAISGGTDESRISARQGANKAKVSGLRQVFAGADWDRRNTQNSLENTMGQLENQRQRRTQNREDNIQGLTGALGSVAGMYLANNMATPTVEGGGVPSASAKNLGATGNVAGITGNVAPTQANFKAPKLSAVMNGAKTNVAPQAAPMVNGASSFNSVLTTQKPIFPQANTQPKRRGIAPYMPAGMQVGAPGLPTGAQNFNYDLTVPKYNFGGR